MKFNIFICGILLIIFSSCNETKKNTSTRKLEAIASDFESSKYYDFASYFKANSSTIVIDSTKVLTVKCVEGELKLESMFGGINNDEMSIAKKTYAFCKRHEVYGVFQDEKYSIIETNVWDSSYTQLIAEDPDFSDSEIDLYQVKDLKNTPYKYSILILRPGYELDDIHEFKNVHLTQLDNNIYFYRSFKYWDIERFDMFECGGNVR